MNKILAVLAVATLSFPLAINAHADEDRTMHYEAPTPETADAAVQSLKDNVAHIGKILSTEALDDSHLEAVHETSYNLEAAIDKLIADKAGAQAALEAVDEAVQAIHYASEEHKEAKTRKWFTALEDSIAALEAPVTKEAPAKKAVYEIVIKDHKFTPETITVPAGEKIKLKVINNDSTPEEFESHDMNREKIITGNSKATIFVGPLKPGKYHYFGEFNMDTANGYIIAE